MLSISLTNRLTMIVAEIRLTRFVKLINKRIPHKILWGTDYPAIRYAKGIGEVDQLELSPEVTRLFLSDNARRVFNLPASTGPNA